VLVFKNQATKFSRAWSVAGVVAYPVVGLSWVAAAGLLRRLPKPLSAGWSRSSGSVPAVYRIRFHVRWSIYISWVLDGLNGSKGFSVAAGLGANGRMAANGPADIRPPQPLAVPFPAELIPRKHRSGEGVKIRHAPGKKPRSSRRQEALTHFHFCFLLSNFYFVLRLVTSAATSF
jgi:hypothetical protein